jgi:hypothetical protein
MRHRLALSLATLTTLGVGGACYKVRNVDEPVPGAVSVTFPDSAKYVIDASVRAIEDEGIGIKIYDRKRNFVESQDVDINMLKSTKDRTAYFPEERVIKFQFRTVPVMGATQLVGEAIWNPRGQQGRAFEKMVPENHAAREVLARMFARVQRRLEDDRADRERAAEKKP